MVTHAMFIGGLMKEAVKALGAAGALNIMSKTSVADRVIKDATDRVKAAADFLEEVERVITQEDEE